MNNPPVQVRNRFPENEDEASRPWTEWFNTEVSGSLHQIICQGGCIVRLVYPSQNRETEFRVKPLLMNIETALGDFMTQTNHTHKMEAAFDFYEYLHSESYRLVKLKMVGDGHYSIMEEL